MHTHKAFLDGTRRVVIPGKILRKLGLQAYSAVMISETDGKIILTPVAMNIAAAQASFTERMNAISGPSPEGNDDA